MLGEPRCRLPEGIACGGSPPRAPRRLTEKAVCVTIYRQFRRKENAVSLRHESDMSRLTVPVTCSDEMPLGTYLRKYAGISAGMLKRLKQVPDGITRSGMHLRTVDPVRSGDVILLHLPEHCGHTPNPALPVPVVYESAQVLVCDKPAGIPAHPSVRHREDTLANWFAAVRPECGFHLLNRLDRNTSGLCLIAKTAYAANRLRGQVQKRYYALVPNGLTGSGTVDAPIAREQDSVITRCVRPDGKPKPAERIRSACTWHISAIPCSATRSTAATAPFCRRMRCTAACCAFRIRHPERRSSCKPRSGAKCRRCCKNDLKSERKQHIMKDWKLSQTQPQFERIRRLPEQRVSKHIIILLLLAAAMWFGGQIGMAVFSIPFSVIFSALGVPLLGNPTIGMIITLFLTIVTVLLTYVLIGPIERRTLRTAGLTKHRCVRDYLTGGALGFVMFAVVIFMAWATGAVRPAAPDQDRNILLMILMFGGWMVQGFSEEFLCRGFLMMSTGTHHKPWLAVFISSALFGLGHVFNAGASVAGVLNVILFGVTMGVIMLRTDSIWTAAALHSVWNWWSRASMLLR